MQAGNAPAQREFVFSFTHMRRALIETVLQYLKLGYRPIPVVWGTKQAAVKWKSYQMKAPTEAEIMAWFSAGEANIALVTGNEVVVVDLDDPALLNAVIEHCGDTPMRCRTPRGGFHLYYRMRMGIHYGSSVKIKDRPLDLRCEGAYVVVPWSCNADGVAYRWLGRVLPASELPILKVNWLRERKPRRFIAHAAVTGHPDTTVRRARAYLAHVEGAISGQRGHDRTMRVAGILIQKFGLTIDQAWPLILEWNQRCEPPWQERDLRHKLEDARRLRSHFRKEGV